MTTCNFQFEWHRCRQKAIKEGKCFWHAHIDKNLEKIKQNYPQYANLKERLLTENGEKQLVGFYLKGANLEGANLKGANLKGANLWVANLWVANLEESKLKGANLSQTNLKGANLRGADLSQTNLKGANLKGANLKGANLKGANLRGADLWIANLKGANLRGADLSQTKLEGANLEGANLEGANLEGADFERVTLQEALNLTVRQFSKVQTLCGAKLDSTLMEQIKKDHPHLLEEPKPDMGEERRSPRNGRQKMKLQTAYWKNADGSIKVTIKVADKGDFPTANIFGSSSGYPAEESGDLGEGSRDSISKTLPTPDEARQWTSAQINALKEKLDNWESIQVPEPEEFGI